MSFVSVLDSLIVWVFFLSALISLILPKPRFQCRVGPFTLLCSSTNAVPGLCGPLSLVHHTEVSLLQGAGLASLPRLVVRISIGSHVFAKALILLMLVLLCA